MDVAPQYLLCHENDNWVVFGLVEMADTEADALVIVMNDQFAETGYRVKRSRGIASDAEGQSAVRRFQREWEFWLGVVTRWKEGTEEAVDEDYPIRYQCWSELDGAIGYVREMANEGPLTIQVRQPEVTIDAVTTVDWYFERDPPAGSSFRFGPIFSQLKTVANALRIDERTLKANNGQAYAWIRRRGSRDFVFWFEYDTEYQNVLNAVEPQG